MEQFSLLYFVSVAPELALVALAGLVIGYDVLNPQADKRHLGLMTAIGLGVTLLLTVLVALPTVGAPIFGQVLRNDMLAFVFRLLVVFAALVVALISVDAPAVGKQGEYYLVLLTGTLGMNMMALANDLIVLYLAVETTSIALYALTGYMRQSDRSAEAGIKYFLYGAFASTVMLYGFSLLYGFTGGTNLQVLSFGMAVLGTPIIAVGLAFVFIFVGLAFKVSIFPFHFWAPDVYEGAPTPITAFLSVASKAAGFVVLLRVLSTVFPGLAEYWVPLVAVVAAFTMTIGNLLALAQKNLKRLLAYSSIAQAGYMLLGVAANTGEGTAAVVYYLGMYTLTNLAAFAVIVLVSRVTGGDDIADFAGLSRRAPGLALVMLVAILSLGGIPPFAGFFGKFYLFMAALQQPALTWLVIVALINAIISLYYYLVILKVIYLDAPQDDTVTYPVPGAYTVALWLCAVGVMLVGVVIGPWVGLAQTAAAALF